MDKQSKWKWASGKSRNWNKRLAFFDGTSKRNKETPVNFRSNNNYNYEDRS